jgi:hypothetical protein
VRPRGPAELKNIARGLDRWQEVWQQAAALVASGKVPAEQAAPTAGEAPGEGAAGSTVSARWDTCDTAPAGGTLEVEGSDSSDSATVLGMAGMSITQFTTPLPALPSPCSDTPLPRMVMIDVVIISANQLSTRKFGINLLDQLEVVLTGSVERSIVQGGEEAGTVTTLIGNLALPEAGILYSLNIANAIEARNELVARPTLVALDRRTSSFASGESLFVGISGTLEGGDVVQIPGGILLYVAPTFIDKDSMLLAVSASTASFATVGDVLAVEASTFENQVAVTRNSVQANVMMDVGQTLVLSGLVERKVSRDEDKVPLLGDVPGPGSAFNARHSSGGRQLRPRDPHAAPGPWGSETAGRRCHGRGRGRVPRAACEGCSRCRSPSRS